MDDVHSQREMSSLEDVRARGAALMPEVIAELEALVAHASVSFPGFPQDPMNAAAAATAALFRKYGLLDARLVEVPGGHSLVYGEVPGPPGAPVVLLYAHYDVQPVTDPEEWGSDPWALTTREGRLYGRGAADDKSGILIHAAALRLLGPRPPVGIRLVIEGDEESTSRLPEFVAAHPDLFRADVILVADMGNAVVGEPMLVSSLRGEVAVLITVRTLSRRAHSGEYGGPVPDAMMAMIRILDSLIDENGDVAVEGLTSREWRGKSHDPEDIRRGAGMLERTRLIGSATPTAHLLSRPAATIIGIDAPGTAEATNSLLPAVKAKVSFRIAGSGDDSDEANAIVRHIHDKAPFGAEVKAEVIEATPAFSARHGRAIALAQEVLTEVYDVECHLTGSGASIPLLGHLATASPAAEFVLFGAEDGEARVHDANESVDSMELERMIVAEALLLQRLGGITIPAAQ